MLDKFWKSLFFWQPDGDSCIWKTFVLSYVVCRFVFWRKIKSYSRGKLSGNEKQIMKVESVVEKNITKSWWELRICTIDKCQTNITLQTGICDIPHG